MIQEKMNKGQDLWKSYVDHRKRLLEFEEGGHMFLKVIPRLKWKGPFKMHKLSLRYVRLYQIVRKVGEVAYQLEFPPSLFGLHDVFHILQL